MSPRPGQPPHFVTRALRSLLSLAALLALTVGVFWALTASVGNPLDHWSSVRAGDMSDQDVIAIIAGVTYLVWASFCLAVLVESVELLTARLHRRRRPHPRRSRVTIPLLGVQRHVARSLLTSILLVFPLALTTFGPATSALASSARPPVVASQQAFVPSTPHSGTPATHTITPQHRTAPTVGSPAAPAAHVARVGTVAYEVPSRGGMRTLWSLSEHYLGQGGRWRELWSLNEGRTQADGTVMTNPGQLRPGWTVLIPAAAADAAGIPSTGQTTRHHDGQDTAAAAPQTAPGEHEVTVHDGDTLSQLAAADGVTDWHQVWPANTDRAEPGGRHFTDPNLILPGWTIVLPGEELPDHAAPPTPAAHPAPTDSEHAAGGHQGSAPQPPPATHPTPPPSPTEVSHPHPGRHAAGTPTRLHAVPPVTDHHPVTALTTALQETEPPVTAHELGTGIPASAATAAGAGAGAATVMPRPAGTERENSAVVSVAEWTLSIGGGAGLLGGMLYAAMRVARRRRLRRRLPGRCLSAPASAHVPLEQALITDGAVAQRDVVFIDHALRSLAADLAASDGRLPAIVAARLTAEHLDLVLTGPALEAPPAPWVAVSATSWAIAKTADLPPLAELRATQAAPYPTLVSVGATTAGEEWLVDLEQAGALAFDGDPERCLDLVRFIVAELAYNPWSDPLLVTVAGFGAELVALNPQRLIHTEDVTAAATVANRAVQVNREVADSHHIDVLHGRLHGISGDAWMPQVLVVAPGWAERETDVASVDRLLATVGRRASRSAVAVVLAGDRTAGSPAGLRLIVQADGTLLIPDLQVTGTASQLPCDQAVALADYFTAERNGPVDVPIAASGRTAGSAAFADAAGALRAEFRSGQPAEPAITIPDGNNPAVINLTTAITLPAAGLPVLPSERTTDEISISQRGGAELLVTVPPTVAAEVTAAVVASDPTLDADLADWYDPACPRPKFDLLGPVEVRAKGAVPTKGLPLTVEAMLYLVLHPRGVTGDRFANDLWPRMNYTFATSSNPRAVLTAARNWAGADPVTGEKYLVGAAASKAVNGVGLYRFVGALDSVDLFYRLRTRGEARGEDGREDLMAALRLVTGVPLSGIRPMGGAWLAQLDVSSDSLTAAIADVADDVATAALAADDIAQARQAAQIALLTEAAGDRPLLALAACLEREGRQAELSATVRRIMTHHDDVLDNEDPPEATIEILRRNGWLELLTAG